MEKHSKNLVLRKNDILIASNTGKRQQFVLEY